MPVGTGQHPATGAAPATPAPTPGYTNADGTFNPNGSAANANTATTGTDLYGLNPSEEQWTFYGGYSTPDAAAGRNRAADAEARRGMSTSDGRQPTPAVSTNQYKTALDLMKQFSGEAGSPDPLVRQQWANTQAQLNALGFYGTSGGSMLYRPGTWSDNDAAALLKAFKSYQQQAGPDGAGLPITFSDYLDKNSAQAAANGQAGGASSAASQAILDDPALLRSTVMSAAQAALGRGLSNDQLEKFVAQFQGAQASYQQNSNTTTVRPDAPADANAFAQASDPQQYANHQSQAYMNALLNVFLPSADSRATITPVASA